MFRNPTDRHLNFFWHIVYSKLKREKSRREGVGTISESWGNPWVIKEDIDS